MTKNEIRKSFLLKRDALKNRYEKSSTICTKVINSDVFKNSRCVFVYLSYKSEVNTFEIVRKCFNEGKRVCVPYTDGDGIMYAVEIESLDGLVKNKWGIFEPKTCEKKADKSQVDLCIAPGSVFDRQLNRIGYGKGYYDRFLKGANAFKMALAFECQIAEELPNEPFDIKMDCIVTENGVIGKNI